ncbi:MAG: hypothetical protein Q8S33_21175 [Myxococcales bacterium]|nr:hypothetical protein [Myxococcales bacterium]MDP3502859.1 hypothetical protein [Myxococcales bacterium]
MRRTASLLGVIVLVLIAPLAAVPSYDFPGKRPFEGDSWANPYEGWQGPFLKVNLHAHSRAWGGLTAGQTSPDELAHAYAERGFAALAVSNYHQVTRVDAAPLPMIRAYEHGLNLSKSHRLVLGTDDAIGVDFPISTRSSRQWVLDVLGHSGGLVGLTHPSLRQGHSCQDVEALTGFQLLEVHNPYARSLAEWDCALSAGRLAWAVGNDDAHSAREESIGIAWNMVGAEAATEGALLGAIGSGRSYVVRGERGRMDVQVVSLEVDEVGAMTLSLDGAARVEWLVDSGAVQHVEESVSVSRFVPSPGVHYVRAVVRTPITELVLNPIVRSGRWSRPVATIDWVTTFGFWAGWLAAAAAFAWLGRPRAHLRLVAEPVKRAA